MSGSNLMLIPYVKLEPSHNGFFFWLENSTDRRHIGSTVCSYNEDTKQLRIARWVLHKNAKLWGLRIEKSMVVIVTAEMADDDNPREPARDFLLLEVRKQLDTAQQAINAALKLLA